MQLKEAGRHSARYMLAADAEELAAMREYSEAQRRSVAGGALRPNGPVDEEQAYQTRNLHQHRAMPLSAAQYRLFERGFDPRLRS